MVSEKGLSLKRTVPFLLIGILIFLVYLYFFADISQTIAIIQGVDLFYYSIAVAVLFLIMIINALTWQYFLRPLLVKVSFRKTFLFTWIGVFADLLVPAESLSGDASKVYLMTKESGENAGKVVASVVSHRILAMIISLGSLIFSSIILYAIQYELPAFVLNLVLIIIVGTGVTLFFIFLCILKETLTQRIIDAVIRFLAFVSRGRLKLDSMRTKATNVLSAFHGSIVVLLKNPKNLVAPVFFSIMSWIFSRLLSYLVFVSLGQPVDFVLITIVYSISVNIQSIPIGIPAEVGLVEIVMTSLYGLLGVDAGIAAAATVLIRLLTVWLRIIIGIVAVHWIDLKDLAKNLRQDLF
ncbi:flippase-like domain-containing protein [Candidatus Bathyarchaeota archaeon]|nr:flippase-like domain-containing protein [Candidatus Bathyarchaeota archaeon]